MFAREIKAGLLVVYDPFKVNEVMLFALEANMLRLNANIESAVIALNRRTVAVIIIFFVTAVCTI